MGWGVLGAWPLKLATDPPFSQRNARDYNHSQIALPKRRVGPIFLYDPSRPEFRAFPGRSCTPFPAPTYHAGSHVHRHAPATAPPPRHDLGTIYCTRYNPGCTVQGAPTSAGVDAIANPEGLVMPAHFNLTTQKRRTEFCCTARPSRASPRWRPGYFFPLAGDAGRKW